VLLPPSVLTSPVGMSPPGIQSVKTGYKSAIPRFLLAHQADTFPSQALLAVAVPLAAVLQHPQILVEEVMDIPPLAVVLPSVRSQMGNRKRLLKGLPLVRYQTGNLKPQPKELPSHSCRTDNLRHQPACPR
jgi:hypothetical protein